MWCYVAFKITRLENIEEAKNELHWDEYQMISLVNTIMKIYISYIIYVLLWRKENIEEENELQFGNCSQFGNCN